MKQDAHLQITDHRSQITRANSSDEFAPGASEWPAGLSRREFLRLSGATLALSGLGACTKQPLEKIVPYVEQPEIVIPGQPLRFATATQYNGFGQGLLVTSYEGRPTKIEGNPTHPASLGATTVWAQADVLDLYDPDRAQTVTTSGAIKTLDDFWNALNFALDSVKPGGGATLRILTESITSPTLLAQLADVMQRFPAARWCIWDPLNRDNFNTNENICDFSKAKVVVAFDADFLYAHPHALRYARDFSNARRIIAAEGARMNRLYVAEPTPTITGSNADHRIAVAAHDILPLAQAIASKLGTTGLLKKKTNNEDWIDAVAGDLKANRGEGVIIAGETQPPEVHALMSEMNAALGNNGITMSPVSPLVLPANRLGFRELVDEMHRGAVELLVVLGGNPRYDAPADFDFAAAFEKVKLRVHHSAYFNETSRHSHWHVPALHFLESWSDTRAFDGSISVVQPLIEPMYAGTSAHEILEALTGQSPRTSYEIVRSRWQAKNQVPDFEAKWRRALSDGVIKELTPPTINSVGPASSLNASTLQPFNVKLGSGVSPGCERARWALRKQRLASRIATAVFQAGLGQRGANQPAIGQARKIEEWRPYQPDFSRSSNPGAGLDSTWSGGELRDIGTGLWARSSRPSRTRCRIQCLRVADGRRALVRRWTNDSQKRRAA